MPVVFFNLGSGNLLSVFDGGLFDVAAGRLALLLFGRFVLLVVREQLLKRPCVPNLTTFQA